MKNKDYIGIDLAKKLHEAGFEKLSEMMWWHPCGENGQIEPTIIQNCSEKYGRKLYTAYSYFDIMTKYAKEFFGENNMEYIIKDIIGNLILMLQQNKPQKEIDKYIEDNTILLK